MNFCDLNSAEASYTPHRHAGIASRGRQRCSMSFGQAARLVQLRVHSSRLWSLFQCSSPLVAALAAASARGSQRLRRHREVFVSQTAARNFVSPFAESSGLEDEETYALTAENVEFVLDQVRPALQADG
eukprot:2257219-Amphidinium_carterae.2